MSRIRESGKSAEAQSPGSVPSVARERVSAWRHIEVWRERQALKRALADLESDDPAVDETIFLQDPAHRGRYFTPDAGEDGVAAEDDADDAEWEDIPS